MHGSTRACVMSRSDPPRGRRGALLGAGMIALLTLLALFGPRLSPYAFNTLDWRHLAVGQRQRVVPTWIEVLMQVYAIQDVGNQLLQEQSRRNADLAAQTSGHGARKCVEVVVVHDTAQPLLVGLTLGVDVPNAPPYRQQRHMVERGQTNLNRTWVVKATISAEVHMQTLR